MSRYEILKSVSGNFNQSDSRFGYTAGTQCSCNALYSIFWSKIRSVSIWTSKDLDKILISGDQIYKSLNTNMYLSVDDLPKTIEIAGYSINVNLLELFTGEATMIRNDPFLRTFLGRYNNSVACILIIGDYTLALFRFTREICFIFDSHSRNDRGFPVPNGNSICMKFPNLQALECYIPVSYTHLTLPTIYSV